MTTFDGWEPQFLCKYTLFWHFLTHFVTFDPVLGPTFSNSKRDFVRGFWVSWGPPYDFWSLSRILDIFITFWTVLTHFGHFFDFWIGFRRFEPPRGGGGGGGGYPFMGPQPHFRTLSQVWTHFRVFGHVYRFWTLFIDFEHIFIDFWAFCDKFALILNFWPLLWHFYDTFEQILTFWNNILFICIGRYKSRSQDVINDTKLNDFSMHEMIFQCMRWFFNV